MKPENLESLLLDRALGLLAPEVEDLLEAHVAREPDGARRAAVFAGTVLLARRAVAAQATPQLRATRGAEAQWRRVQRALRWRAMGRDALKLAAGLMLGLGLAWMARPTATIPSMPLAAEAMSARPNVEAHAAPAFWSSARLAAEAQRASERGGSGRARLQANWLAPAKPSKVEGKL